MTLEPGQYPERDLAYTLHGRNGLPKAVWERWSAGESLTIELVIEAWSWAEFPQIALQPADVWVTLFEAVGFGEGERPTEPIRLYRGCTVKRGRRMSWTDDLDKARWFAHREMRFGNDARVYTTLAHPESLLAHVGDMGRASEHEWIVNPRLLGKIEAIHALLREHQ